MPRQEPADNRRTAPLNPECARVRSRLLPFLDGEMDGDARQEIQRHLDVCAGCRDERDWQLQADRALESARRQAPAPGDLRAGFYARLEATPSRRPIAWGGPLRLAAPVLALSALAAILILPQAARRGVTAPDDPGHGRLHSSRNDNLAGRPLWTPLRVQAGLQPGFGIAANNRNAPAAAAQTETRDHDARTAPPHRSDGERRRTVARVKRDSLEVYAPLPKIAMRMPAVFQVPHIHLPPVADADRVAMNLSLGYMPASNLPADTEYSRARRTSAAMTRDYGAARADIPAFSDDRAESTTTRADLMNEEVNVHIVNAQNEEVKSLHVAAGGAPATGSTVHVEADDDAATSGF